ncbi:MAG: hypothetical protein OHK0046_11520 [Anaerolineae bacterium]
MSVFSRRTITALLVGFISIILASNLAVRYTCTHIATFDCPEAWPISLFYPQLPTVWSLALAFALLIGFFPLAGWLDARGYRLREVLVVALLAVVLTNLLPGLDLGYNEPMTHRDQQYYNTALTVDNPLSFIRDYNALQPNLGLHAQTHPPGAVITIYLFERLFRQPELISLMIGVVAMTASVSFAYRIFLMAFNNRLTAGYGALLFAVIPAVQIYTLACLDALITAMFTGVLYFMLLPEHHPKTRPFSTLMGGLLLFWAFFCTFPALVILPILFGYEWVRFRRIWHAGAMLLMVLLGLGLLYALGFNYLDAFRYAENFENPQGFALISHPVNYVFTRLECVAEILVFFGPFLTVLAVRGWPVLRRDFRREALLLGLLVLTLTAVFLVGTYRTGETARPLMFLYVYALFPVLAALLNANQQARVSVLVLVFSQAVFMQLFGIYLW